MWSVSLLHSTEAHWLSCPIHSPSGDAETVKATGSSQELPSIGWLFCHCCHENYQDFKHALALFLFSGSEAWHQLFCTNQGVCMHQLLTGKSGNKSNPNAFSCYPNSDKCNSAMRFLFPAWLSAKRQCLLFKAGCALSPALCELLGASAPVFIWGLEA